jgi:hypothetical protein
LSGDITDPSTRSAPWIPLVVPTPKRPAGRPTRLAHPLLTVSSHLLPVMPLQITAMARRQASPKAFRTVLPLQPLQALFIPPLSIRQLRRCPDRSAPALRMRLLSSNIRLSSSSSNSSSSNRQQQQQQQQQLNGSAGYGFGGYGVLGMGLPSVGMLGGFPYGNQVASFGGVCAYCFI